MLNEHQVIEMLPAYALEALEVDEAGQVEAHLAECETCRAELRALQAITDDLPLAIEEIKPPAGIHERLMARIETPAATALSSDQSSRWQHLIAVFRRPRAMAYSQLALLSLVVILLISNFLLWQQVKGLESSSGPDRMLAIHLDSTGLIPAADGILNISADGLSGAIILDQLPQLDEEQQYQLWLVKDGQRTGAALISVDELGYGGNRVRAPQPLFNYSWAEITIETAGGSPQPTSDIILKAPLFP
jgi:anti-sigma-K factor RskA